ncbi:Store-operated calcium entry regulator STIMATE [Trinorchestia longiramus]|nr:Store-operated calcium entry regulator STIMATE [Trinorchestia longiramus]
MEMTAVDGAGGALGLAHNLLATNNSSDEDAHCGRDALTNSYGWFVQLLLATLAFMLLIVKRFCEPVKRRRSWMVWFYDTSKQGLGAALVHFSNVVLAEEFTGDPCTWYIVSFLLDSTFGLVLVWAGIRLTIYIGRKYRLPTLIFGEYGRPPSCVSWAHQCLIYCALMAVEKLLVTLLMRLPYWTSVRDIILAPITSPQLRVVVVVLIIPFFVNAIIFWVTDNFLMLKVKGSGQELPVTTDKTTDPTLRSGMVFYKRCGGSSSASSSEGDILINHAQACGIDDSLPLHQPTDDWQVTFSNVERSPASDSSDIPMLGIHESLSSSPFSSPDHVASGSISNNGTLVPVSPSVVLTPNIPKHRHLSFSSNQDINSLELELRNVASSPSRPANQLQPQDIAVPHSLNEQKVLSGDKKPGKKML